MYRILVDCFDLMKASKVTNGAAEWIPGSSENRTVKPMSDNFAINTSWKIFTVF